MLLKAHHIRNRSSQTFKAACAVTSHFRWCLTGTPIHNSLDDYGALLAFIRVPSLTDKSKFDFWIASPIKQGNPDSLNRLQDLIKATCLRRTKKMIKKSLELPPRRERTEFIELNETDRELYTYFKERTAAIAASFLSPTTEKAKSGGLEESNILSLINFLRLICNHGTDLLPPSVVAAWEARDGVSIDWQSMQRWKNRSDVSDANTELTDHTSHNSPQPDEENTIRADPSPHGRSDPEEEEVQLLSGALEGMGDSNSRELASRGIRASAKVQALLRNLHHEQRTRQDLNSESLNKRYVNPIVFTAPLSSF